MPLHSQKKRGFVLVVEKISRNEPRFRGGICIERKGTDVNVILYQVYLSPKNPHSGLSPVQRSVHFMLKEGRMAIISSLNHQLLDVVQYFHFIVVITFPEFFSVCLMISSSMSMSP